MVVMCDNLTRRQLGRVESRVTVFYQNYFVTKAKCPGGR